MHNSSLNNSEEIPIKPFLRWAGGKTHIVKFLEKHLPSNILDIDTYHEPFLGAGSLFFYLSPKNAILSDSNRDLIECFKAIKKRPELIDIYLKKHLNNNSKDYYYQMRNLYNSSKFSISKAALFIYLNKTSFNGIWRVNKRGKFNVPYGNKDSPCLPTKDQLINISKLLTNVKIIHCGYSSITNAIGDNDFIYIDPPYPPLNGTSYFTHYTKERFTKENHYELSLFLKKLNKKRCKILISNADTPYIRSLYENDFNIVELKVIRWIRADGKRYKVNEIAIKNYDK